MGLLDMLMPSKGQSPSLGSGMAGKAQSDLSGRGYQLYAQEAQAMGQRPLPLEQWLRMHQSQ
ncbi:MAG: hypothetical protein ACRCVX_11955 [Shewanella sp.]